MNIDIETVKMKKMILSRMYKQEFIDICDEMTS